MIEILEVKESARPAQPNASKDISEPTTQRKSTTIIAESDPGARQSSAAASSWQQAPLLSW